MEAEPRTVGVCFWNIWGHRHPKELHSHLQSLAQKTDIICLTEVTHCNTSWSVPAPVHTSDRKDEAPSHLNGYAQLQAELGRSHYSEYRTPVSTDWRCVVTGDTYRNVGFGSALFYSKKLQMHAHGTEIICKGLVDIKPRALQWIVFSKGGKRYLVAHVHGIWIKENTKGDHPARRQQSAEVRVQLHKLATEHTVEGVVFGGDLNLAPDTEALKLLLKSKGVPELYRNLNHEWNINSTRTPAYRHYETKGESLHADYVLANTLIRVKSFTADTTVPGSDHAPLLIRFV
jgi:endonuclease/exonuclease/phosphatase family metal-dependent hydrolase